MIFNPDITKQTIEVVFPCKDKKPDHPELTFNGIPITRKPFTKHVGVYLDSRLNFSKHIREKVAIAIKGVSLLRFLIKFVDRNVLTCLIKCTYDPILIMGTYYITVKELT